MVLGGELTPAVDEHLRTHGAIIFPTDPSAPVPVYRGSLYTADELYAGLDLHGYPHTPDARAYAWFEDAELRHDPYVSVLRAIHDDAMSDALVDVADGRRTVGVMGGHAWQRGTSSFAKAAKAGFDLAEDGALVLTGGGPGAMEAANLGAFCRDAALLDDAVSALAAVPSFEPSIDAWAREGFAVRHSLAQLGDPQDHRALRSVGIPTWFYGHEPPNVFGEQIAKFFSNALREDLLLHHSRDGLLVLPGAAGTVQEVFQMATRQYYEVDDRVPPVVLVGIEHWTERLPVWPLLKALGQGRTMADRIHLVDEPDEAVELLLTR